MVYRVKVAGKIFEGNDYRILLKRAIEARRTQLQAPPFNNLNPGRRWPQPVLPKNLRFAHKAL